MALLQAKASPILIFQDKNTEATNINENINISIVSNNALLPTTSPQSALGVTDDVDFDSETDVYVVRAGDTVSQVADMFGISVNTILTANDMKKGEKLKEGDVLLILPFSGIEHTVLKGQTLQSIANLYKVDLNEIFFANDIERDASLVVGESLIIPGAEISDDTTSPSKTKTKTVTKEKDPNLSVPSVAGYFKNPVPGAKRSRGIKPGHRGVDLAAPTGTPIHAAADGTVLIAREGGYNGGFGTYAVIQHPNGSKTLYAHMSKVNTTPGTKVSQGEVIGLVGSTGRSTGPHLHIETIGAKNPF